MPGGPFEYRHRMVDQPQIPYGIEDMDYMPGTHMSYSYQGDVPRSMGPMNQMSLMGVPPGYDPEMLINASQGFVSEDVIRSTNLSVQVANSNLCPSTPYAQLQPKRMHDGRYPQDFRMARTVEEMKCIEGSTLDRILQAYNLPTDLRSFGLSSADVPAPRVIRMAKLCTLFDFLGATQLSSDIPPMKRRRAGLLPITMGHY
ncbi:hypothetical protein EJ05DRAFT_497718 [Pseudovirgaria hyperparasitica]|uniref:Uncharacterized protein n=1 Tax=Pseudovirgaria hyperparasitica TaxID=470096 RepID=A0A6A6WGI4_9PEZI|nr:uncharacterized protein EJ05DRAFT_497718 [Pseudovirgaria hyperparasitica]KAF2761160.1 hypothetical protein EJ05DRAFT_497718 [Pseudovirgaria hyperparasitica]